MLRRHFFNICDASLSKLTARVLLNSELTELILHQIFKHWNYIFRCGILILYVI